MKINSNPISRRSCIVGYRLLLPESEGQVWDKSCKKFAWPVSCGGNDGGVLPPLPLLKQNK